MCMCVCVRQQQSADACGGVGSHFFSADLVQHTESKS